MRVDRRGATYLCRGRERIADQNKLTYWQNFRNRRHIGSALRKQDRSRLAKVGPVADTGLKRRRIRDGLIARVPGSKRVEWSVCAGNYRLSVARTGEPGDQIPSSGKRNRTATARNRLRLAMGVVNAEA